MTQYTKATCSSKSVLSREAEEIQLQIWLAEFLTFYWPYVAKAVTYVGVPYGLWTNLITT